MHGRTQKGGGSDGVRINFFKWKLKFVVQSFFRINKKIQNYENKKFFKKLDLLMFGLI